MELETYAFIDVQNTEGTADFLGFVIDWNKLADHLTTRYTSKGNYFYLGIEEGDTVRTAEFSALTNERNFIKPKFYKKYRQRDKFYPVTCATCKTEFLKRVQGRFDWKCNCDVDLTIDVIDVAHGRPIRTLLFTGDGDFRPLVEKLMSEHENSQVYIFSSPTKINGMSRLAIKLRELTKIYKDRVIFVDIDLLKKKIEKEL